MQQATYEKYTAILRKELIPATGCTEPIALAYAAALGRRLLGCLPERVDAAICGSIIKNVKSVVVPGTGGLKGIEAAIAAGLTVGDPDRELEVLSSVTEEGQAAIAAYMAEKRVRVTHAETAESFDILLTLSAGDNTARVRIAGHHTNVVLLEKNGQVILEQQTTLEGLQSGARRQRPCA